MKEHYRQLENSLIRKEDSQKKLIEHQYQLLTMMMKNQLGKYTTSVNHLEETLKILNPVNPLKRGYVLISKGDKVLGPKDEIKLDDQLTIRREQDEVLVNVLKIEEVKK
jgi:exonuclease VII large subunit